MKRTKVENNTKKTNRQFWLAVGLCAAGVGLLFTSILLPPVGIIHTSVLTASGEIFLLSGGILGVDAVYSIKLKEILNNYFNQNDEESESNGG